MYQFVCYGNRLHLFFQTLSCCRSAYSKYPELSSSWLFYLPSFFKPKLLQLSHPERMPLQRCGTWPSQALRWWGSAWQPGPKLKARLSWERQNPRSLRDGGVGRGPVAGWTKGPVHPGTGRAWSFGQLQAPAASPQPLWTQIPGLICSLRVHSRPYRH